jgi:hypothetical protein
MDVDVDPDPSYHVNADSDPTLEFDADPDPQHCLNPNRNVKLGQLGRFLSEQRRFTVEKPSWQNIYWF